MKTTASLEQDHRMMELMLPVVERMAGEFEGGQFVRGYDLAGVLEFLREFVDGCHHLKEEQQLFPALEARGVPRESGLLSELVREHQEARRCVGIITAAMSEVIGEDPGAEMDFAEYGRAYAALMREHIKKEDSQLFPLAERSLSDEDDARLARAFAEIEEESIGKDGPEHFRQLAADLAAAAEQ